jgi:hypothetical protein
MSSYVLFPLIFL